jgi:CheY-like chemotaxis protein
VIASPAIPGSILLVEDDLDIRACVFALLSAQGYGVTIAENGRAALEQLGESPEPALILLDLKMPIMDGWEFLRAQHADRRFAHIPVLISTNSLLPEDAWRDYPSVRGSVTKLLDVDGFLDAVRRYKTC